MTRLTEMNSWLTSLKSFALTKNEDVKEKLHSQGIEIFDFTLGDPKEPTPAFIRRALIEGVDEVSQYPLNIGSLIFRKACAFWIKNRILVDLDLKTEIISTNGSKEAVFHIPQVLFNCASSRRLVVFPEPGYPVYKSGTILAGGIPYEIILKKEKNYNFDPADIPQELVSQIAAVWLCYPHNPTGACLSYEKMQEIYTWALKHNIILLSDECYLDIYFEGSEPPHSFLQVAKANDFKNLLCFFSLSKRSGMTGYRSGFVAGDENLISLFAKYRLNVGLGTPDFVQKAAVVAWGDSEHVHDRNKVFAQKRQIIEEFFAMNHIQFLPSQSTIYIWGEAPACYKSGREFTEALSICTGIMATPGDAFGESCFRNFRLALVPPVEKIKECLLLWQEQITAGKFKI